MATQTGKTRTLNGYIADLLEYPRWVIEHEVDFTNCRNGGHFNAFIETCTTCPFGAGCRWLDLHRSPTMDNATIEELSEALESAVTYIRSAHAHDRYCDCDTCSWLREARHFRRRHLKST